jgi:hypothetical protein
LAISDSRSGTFRLMLLMVLINAVFAAVRSGFAVGGHDALMDLGA